MGKVRLSLHTPTEFRRQRTTNLQCLVHLAQVWQATSVALGCLNQCSMTITPSLSSSFGALRLFSDISHSSRERLHPRRRSGLQAQAAHRSLTFFWQPNSMAIAPSGQTCHRIHPSCRPSLRVCTASPPSLRFVQPVNSFDRRSQAHVHAHHSHRSTLSSTVRLPASAAVRVIQTS